MLVRRLLLSSVMAHTSLRDFRTSAHYATIEACLQMGPRDVRNSGATSEMTYLDDDDADEEDADREDYHGENDR